MLAGLSKHPQPEDIDQRVILNGLPWSQLESMLAIRGESSGVRLTYLEGTLELMSPSPTHEYVKTIIARLLEAYAEEAGIFLNGLGSVTMKSQRRKRAVEPDECYVVGRNRQKPDLAIEVIWTSGLLDKRLVYAGLGVRELWEWREGRIQVLVLRNGGYAPVTRSDLLPHLDLALLLSFVDSSDQTAAVRAFRLAVRKRNERR